LLSLVFPCNVRAKLSVSFLCFGVVGAMFATVGTTIATSNQVAFGHHPVPVFVEVKVGTFYQIIITITE